MTRRASPPTEPTIAAAAQGRRTCGWAAPIGCWRRSSRRCSSSGSTGKDAFRAWRLLVTKYGAPAPGPAPARMRVPPPARCGGASRRGSSTSPTSTRAGPAPSSGCAQRADSLERLASRTPEQARTALMSLPGVGEWTAAEIAQRAFGDADALSVGDYHLAKMVGWTSARPSHRRPRDGRAARAAAPAPPSGGAAAGSQWSGPQTALRPAAGDPRTCARM